MVNSSLRGVVDKIENNDNSAKSKELIVKGVVKSDSENMYIKTDDLEVDTVPDEENCYERQCHLLSDKQKMVREKTTFDGRNDYSKNQKDSPGLNRLKSKVKNVDKKIIKVFENEMIKRGKIELSQKNKKYKKTSENINAKIEEIEKVKDAKNKAIKVKVTKSNDKNVVIKDKNIRKFELVSNALLENVRINRNENADTIVNEDAKDGDVQNVKNAFEIMLESTKRGNLTSKKPEKKMKSRRIDLRLSSGKKSFDLKKWCEGGK